MHPKVQSVVLELFSKEKRRGRGSGPFVKPRLAANGLAATISRFEKGVARFHNSFPPGDGLSI